MGGPCLNQQPLAARSLIRRLVEGLPPQAEPVDPLEGGLSAGAWLALWQQCHAATGMGLWRTAWPDGECALAQPALTVTMFGVITSLVLEASKSGEQ